MDRCSESAVPVLLSSELLLHICSHIPTVSALVRSQGKPFAAGVWFVLLESSSSNILMPVPHFPKCPLHSGLLVFTWRYREMDSRKDELNWSLSLFKVTNSSGALQETNTPSDLIQNEKGFLLFHPCDSHCLAGSSNKLDIGSSLGLLNSNKFATEQHCCAWT